jgi:hypothetical protein
LTLTRLSIHSDTGKRRRKQDDEDLKRFSEFCDYATEIRDWLDSDEPRPITHVEIQKLRDWLKGGCYSGHITGGFAMSHLGAMEASINAERRKKEEAIMKKMAYVLDECERLLR